MICGFNVSLLPKEETFMLSSVKKHGRLYFTVTVLNQLIVLLMIKCCL